jgi:hypothetical protein
MRRKMSTRKSSKKSGGGCGCGGMEMLGFPKSGGFFGLFGGQEQLKPVQGESSGSTGVGQSPIMQKSSEMIQPSASFGGPSMGDSQEMMQPRKRSSMDGEVMAKSRRGDMNSPERSRDKKNRVVTEIMTLKSEVQRIKEQLSKMNSSFKMDDSPGLFGGYRATKKNRKYLKKYKQGRSIGFTMRSSLKAKGLIPRANGTYKISKKYRG